MRKVLVESPFAGDMQANIIYARACVRDRLIQGDSPIASHLLYTQEGILNDLVPEERILGIEAGLEWLSVAQASCVYIDKGISSGMKKGIMRAYSKGVIVEIHSLELSPRRALEKFLDLSDEEVRRSFYQANQNTYKPA